MVHVRPPSTGVQSGDAPLISKFAGAGVGATVEVVLSSVNVTLVVSVLTVCVRRETLDELAAGILIENEAGASPAPLVIGADVGAVFTTGALAVPPPPPHAVKPAIASDAASAKRLLAAKDLRIINPLKTSNPDMLFAEAAVHLKISAV
jgi:hypothetical protein